MTTPEARKTILVTGATGGQGGAVARKLLGDGWAVRALVRGTQGRAARQLRSLGAQLVTGDLDDPGSLRGAAQGAYGVFSVQPADLTDPRPEVEVRQGRNVADAAAAAGVAHLVHSSVGGAERGSGVLHFESKAEIETYVDALGLPVTVLRPVFFMDNWRYMLPEPSGGERVGPVALDEDTSLQMIALADVGRIAADAFGRPTESIGEKIEIAGDTLTARQISEALTRADGVPTRLEPRPVEEVWPDGADMARMFAWLNKEGQRADIPALRERYPGLLTFEAWLRGRA
ncbi:NmrA family NAD(P)-binding protein [Streptomyces sp. WAC06614]|uniref:NmrA family NAD(P)-binding protein n=1 Tax=Streptomyces sp. WAC06614 TaxID=2487416 RepID=UPI000F7B0C6F|nr:NmrA family NAD(P)-binding protein [Streptomyces sp. WAC06614]RSS57826.1 NAD-dependent epimerase/dehydratase family protein [Streptomyces sp. WAC06614]